MSYRDKCETTLKTPSQDFTGKWRFINALIFIFDSQLEAEA